MNMQCEFNMQLGDFDPEIHKHIHDPPESVYVMWNCNSKLHVNQIHHRFSIQHFIFDYEIGRYARQMWLDLNYDCIAMPFEAEFDAT